MVLKFVSVLLYLVMNNGAAEVRMEQRVFDTLEECSAKTQAVVQKQMASKDFLEGLFGACMQLPVREA